VDARKIVEYKFHLIDLYKTCAAMQCKDRFWYAAPKHLQQPATKTCAKQYVQKIIYLIDLYKTFISIRIFIYNPTQVKLNCTVKKKIKLQ